MKRGGTKKANLLIYTINGHSTEGLFCTNKYYSNSIIIDNRIRFERKEKISEQILENMIVMAREERAKVTVNMLETKVRNSFLSSIGIDISPNPRLELLVILKNISEKIVKKRISG
jgi:hypothetical protein